MAIEEESDRDYITGLFLKNERGMYAMALKIVKEHHTACDMVSESCLKMIEKISYLRAISAQKQTPYILSIVKNTSLIKTRNGKDRIVPVHSKIQPFVEQWMNRGTEYLITDKDGKKMTDAQYRPYFKAIMEQLGFSHCSHECRHTLRSRLDSAGANKKCIDMILVHKSKDVGERVYTHKTVAELKAAIELISR